MIWVTSADPARPRAATFLILRIRASSLAFGALITMALPAGRPRERGHGAGHHGVDAADADRAEPATGSFSACARR